MYTIVNNELEYALMSRTDESWYSLCSRLERTKGYRAWPLCSIGDWACSAKYHMNAGLRGQTLGVDYYFQSFTNYYKQTLR